MQFKCTFTKRFTLSTRNTKENTPRYDSSHKNALRWQL